MNFIPLVTDLLTLLFLVVGLFFMLVGAIGAYRMPDMYNRLHAATKCSTLGLLGLLLAAVLSLPEITVFTKAVLTMLFVFASNPVGSHILAKAGHYVRAPKWEGTLDDEWETDQAHPAPPPTGRDATEPYEPQVNADS